MSAKDGEDDQVVWTFPIINRVQSFNGPLSLGSRLGTMIDSGPLTRADVSSNGRMSVVSSTSGQSSGSIQDTDDVESVEEDINEVKQKSSITFGQDKGGSDYSETTPLDTTEPTAVSGVTTSLDTGNGTTDQEVSEVAIEEDVFVPVRTSVEPGDTVKWVNESDSVKRVQSIQGESFDSGRLDPGQSFTHEFSTSGVTIFAESTSGAQNMSGAVIVGNAQLSTRLPSESEVEVELFEDEEDEDDTSESASASTTPSAKSMSAAAEEKQDRDIGF